MINKSDLSMSGWTHDELNRIDGVEELRLSSLRTDGTLRKQVTIWVVRVGDDLFIRCVNGRDGSWFRATQVRHAGNIQAAGMTKDVSFLEANPDVADQIDSAYRTKYHRYASSIINSVLTPEAKAATIRLVPRQPNNR